MSFVGTVDVRQVGPDTWQLLTLLTWQDATITIVVPEGFVTDFASIPRPLWVLWPKSGAYNPAAIVHDYECRARYRPPSEVHGRFRAMLAALGVWWLRRQALYLGVSQFGPTWALYQLPDGRTVGPGGLDGTPAGYVD